MDVMQRNKTWNKKASVFKPAEISRPQPNPEKISKLAYELFEKRGCTHGSDLDDWLKAEQILKQRNR